MTEHEKMMKALCALHPTKTENESMRLNADIDELTNRYKPMVRDTLTKVDTKIKTKKVSRLRWLLFLLLLGVI